VLAAKPVNGVLAGVLVALLTALTAIGVLAGEEEPEQPARERQRGPSVEQVARGVERARELEFDHLPRVREVTAAEARRAGLRELDRSVPRHRQEVEERLLKLLGLLPPSARLREVLGTALTGEVAGYYVPRTDTLALVRGAGLEGFLAEVALAHELTHALEDQRFGIEPHRASGVLTDRAGAQAALHEGTATLVMVDYLILTRGGGRELPAILRRQVLEQLEGLALPESSGLPRYVREALVFPYSAGAAFVDRIESAGGWAAVDRVFERGGPVSTEQVLHPEKHWAGERPLAVSLRGYRSALPAGARLAARGDVGEFDTAQFLREGNGRRRSERAAAGWGGSAFALWRLPDERDLLVMGWAWDSRRDAAEFEHAARRSLAELESAGAVNGGNEGVVAVVLTPDVSLARRVAQRIAR
jgi:hypothetical protein